MPIMMTMMTKTIDEHDCITICGGRAEVFPVVVRGKYRPETIQRITNPHAQSVAGPEVNAGTLCMRTAGINARRSTPSTGSIPTQRSFLRLVHPTILFFSVQGVFYLWSFRLRQKLGHDQGQGQANNCTTSIHITVLLRRYTTEWYLSLNQKSFWRRFSPQLQNKNKQII